MDFKNLCIYVCLYIHVFVVVVAHVCTIVYVDDVYVCTHACVLTVMFIFAYIHVYVVAVVYVVHMFVDCVVYVCLIYRCLCLRCCPCLFLTNTQILVLHHHCIKPPYDMHKVTTSYIGNLPDSAHGDHRKVRH